MNLAAVSFEWSQIYLSIFLRRIKALNELMLELVHLVTAYNASGVTLVKHKCYLNVVKDMKTTINI